MRVEGQLAAEIDIICAVSNFTATVARPRFSFPERHPDKRWGELMLYVAKKSQFDPNFGGTKLNQILFYADFVSYGRSGKTITGAEYIKQEFGPTPKRLLPVRKQLETRKEAAVQPVDSLGREQQRLVALRDPDLSLFSGEEIALVDQVIEYLRGKSAKEVSELAHNRAWRVAKMGGSIRYEAAFVSDGGSASTVAKTERLRKGAGFVQLRVWFAIRDAHHVELLGIDYAALPP